LLVENRYALEGSDLKRAKGIEMTNEMERKEAIERRGKLVI